MFVVGLAADAGLALIPEGGPLAVRLAMLTAGVGLNAVAGAAYLGARLGPGARDGLMTGLVRRTGRSVARIRTGIELSVLAIGFALGGTFGLGTVLYAVSIGPLLQALLPSFTVRPAGAGVATSRNVFSTGESSSSRQTQLDRHRLLGHEPRPRAYGLGALRATRSVAERDDVLARRPLAVVPDEPGDHRPRLEAAHRGRAGGG